MARSRRNLGVAYLGIPFVAFQPPKSEKSIWLYSHLMDGYLWPESSEQHLPKKKSPRSFDSAP